MGMLNWPFTAGMRRIGPGRMLVDLVPSVPGCRKLELQLLEVWVKVTITMSSMRVVLLNQCGRKGSTYCNGFF